MTKTLAELLSLPQPSIRPALSRRDVRLARAKRLTAELVKRGMEGLVLYRPQPGPQTDFHVCQSRIRILDGSSQTGKTLAAEAEVARAVCGLGGKYPKRDGVALIVGPSMDHIGDPMWAKLAEPGAFSIIKDEHTKLMRAVRPDRKNPLVLDPYDEAYKEKWQDAPPLLSPRMIEKISWEEYGKRAPRIVRLTTGWKMMWHTGEGDPRRGVQLNLWHFDEEVRNPRFFPEAMRGCMRFGGRGFWSATPQTGGQQLYELHERAMAGDPDVSAFSLFLANNPYYPEAEKQAFFNSLSPDDREVMYHGKYTLAGRHIYTMYNPMTVHGVEPFGIPDDWAREVVVDPGIQNCGTIFGAIDPEEQYLIIYDGLLMHNANADRWAAEVAKRQGKYRYSRIIIDKRMGRQGYVGRSDYVAHEYAKALREHGVTAQIAGAPEMAGLTPASDNIRGREEALLRLLQPREFGPFAGEPTLKVMRGCLPDELHRQFKIAHYESLKPDKRAKTIQDLLVTVEYWAASEPGYIKPERASSKEYDGWVGEFLDKPSHRRPNEFG